MHTTKAEIKLFLNNGVVKPQKFQPIKTLPCPTCKVGIPHFRSGKRTVRKFTYVPDLAHMRTHRAITPVTTSLTALVAAHLTKE